MVKNSQPILAPISNTRLTRSIPLLLGLAAWMSLLPQVGYADKPNIIVIMADDLGYGDVQPLNPNSKIATPHFNRLANDGMVFSDAHSPSAVCTPTRYGLVCGRYPWRSKMKRGVLGGYSKPLIESDRQTIATVMNQAGYQTACVGKWHLGLGWQWNDEPKQGINHMGIAGGRAGRVNYKKPITHGPTTLGFDQSFIIPASLDMSPYVYIRDNRVTMLPDKIIEGKKFPEFYRTGEIAEDFKIEEVMDRMTTEACRFVSESSKTDQPFFLYFPLSAPHKPVSPHPRFQGKSEFGPYGDFVAQVDWTLGEIFKVLDENKIIENTLLIVTSDNGSFMHTRIDHQADHISDHQLQSFNSANHKSNGDWRGTKADIWEGGHRVPFFVHWPAKINGGSRSYQTICHTDILATVADVTSQEFDRSSAEDSFSFLPSLNGKDTKRPPVIHQSASGMLAIRSGHWKLIMGSGSGGRQKPRGKAFEKPFCLIDLSIDKSESNNVIDGNQETEGRLFKQFLEISHGDHLQK
ncbi:MAG: arylsulfatase [Planctomycetota bacterium]